MLNRQDLFAEDDKRYYNNSLGFFNLPETMPFVSRLEKLVKKSYNCNVKFQNTYSRIYQNGSFLGIHTDRPGLDISVSVCIKNNNIQWPLCISNNLWNGPWRTDIDTTAWKRDFSEQHLSEGDAVACEGVKFPHWRDKLECGPEEKLVYVFYHWSRA
jgi:hypothetical protein